jgi:hypothetical protein
MHSTGLMYSLRSRRVTTAPSRVVISTRSTVRPPWIAETSASVITSMGAALTWPPASGSESTMAADRPRKPA